jgi:putative DeoR family transcriptional regulator (stage III sporulation protein D)
MKRDIIHSRSVKVADYIIKTNHTVRKAAQEFGVSKSTIYKDVTERLMESDPAKADIIDGILAEHKNSRHIHGGMATKEMYEKKRAAAIMA